MAGDRRLSMFLIFVVILQYLSVISAKSEVIDLNEDNWHQMLEGEWMVEFFAPWCPACKALKPIWQDFAGWSDDLGISVGQVDVTTSPGLSGRFMVTALPTIYHVKEGVFRQYRGSRDREEFMSFIEERRWESLEEIPAWKSPGSMQMSIVSQFFKLSMVLRGVHSILVEDYGLPTWGSYLVFALATIVVGALLGLILVCIIDVMFPPGRSSASSSSLQVGDADEDLIEDSQIKPEEAKEQETKGEVKTEDEDIIEEPAEDEADKSQSEGEDKALSSQGEDNDESQPEEEDEGDVKSSPSGVRKRRPRKAD